MGYYFCCRGKKLIIISQKYPKKKGREGMIIYVVLTGIKEFKVMWCSPPQVILLLDLLFI